MNLFDAKLRRLDRTIREYAECLLKPKNATEKFLELNATINELRPYANLNGREEHHDARLTVTAVAEADSQVLEPRLNPAENDTKEQTPSFAIAALREMTGLGNTALNQYAKRAKVTTPGRGQKNFRYSATDVRAILDTIIAYSSDTTVRAKCQSSLRNLAEITK